MGPGRRLELSSSRKSTQSEENRVPSTHVAQNQYEEFRDFE